MKKQKLMLIADANGENRGAVKKILSEKYEVTETESGKEALERMTENSSNKGLLICSAKLLDMDGFTLLNKIKHTEGLDKTEVIFLTGRNDLEDEKKAIEAGAIDIISPPYNPEVILKRVANAMHILEQPAYHNIVESYVENGIEECIDNLNMCKCETCRQDLLTLVLNRMKPKYVRTQKGELMTKVDRMMTYESRVEILSAIASAAQTISERPHHDK